MLSGGERGRLAMACLALQGANLLLLDEPTNHLDLPSQEILQRVLAEFNGTILLVSHDRFLVDGIATQVWQVRPEQKDMIVFKGNYSELRAELEAQKAAEQDEKDSETKAELPKRRIKAANASTRGCCENWKRLLLIWKSRSLWSARNWSIRWRQHESVEELGEEYVRLQAELDAKWQAWHELFED